MVLQTISSYRDNFLLSRSLDLLHSSHTCKFPVRYARRMNYNIVVELILFQRKLRTIAYQLL